MYRLFGKRAFDLFVAIIGLILAFPLLVILAILVRWRLGSPVFFRHERPGRDGKVFTMYKFRSMTNAVSQEGDLLSDSERVTKFGQFMRSTSLDELPELINVIIGDLSLVGPRPLLKEYLPYYTPVEMVRHQVRPGLTGLAQVSGRNDLPWEDRLALDVEYVSRCCFLLDLKILILTVAKVASREGTLPVPGARFRRLDVERMDRGVGQDKPPYRR